MYCYSGKKQIKLAGAVVEGLTEGTEGEEEGGEEVPVEDEVYKKICVSVALSEFMIKLFTEDTSKVRMCVVDHAH